MQYTRMKAADSIEQMLIGYPGNYRISRKAYNKLMTICDLADMLSEEFDADGISILVDPENGLEGIVQVDMPEMTFGGRGTHPFFAMSKSADYMGFSTHDDGIRVSFLVNNLWEKVDAE